MTDQAQSPVQLHSLEEIERNLDIAAAEAAASDLGTASTGGLMAAGSASGLMAASATGLMAGASATGLMATSATGLMAS